ncbi:DUF1415 domain-containing protein [Marinibactrum halimedae]|uniref:DUF1415 domain-containing protein n=1 Tax=Marinibactrum halimedae TaxID=1444977 RepID=A0AA37T8R2_9GAMM|nr:DUF1415 domain-containing protein [Marinibactrum halimedae]MCD9458020.1 DUF1415 domain-containing protein [Marinibactrum halimedae]GLS27646.1 hypothetical protein GCM10007877_33650 [Marinibactrum halimedae]
MQSINTQVTNTQEVVELTQRWVREVVVGLGLCPFAAKPFAENTIRYCVAPSAAPEDILHSIYSECVLLSSVSHEATETTLVITPNALSDFHDYNQFFNEVDLLLSRNDWEGVLQVASFHPQYQFAGTSVSDAENYTNRAPYPIFHLLREDRLEKAIEFYPDVDEIPERNIARMNALSQDEIHRLFYYLNKT